MALEQSLLILLIVSPFVGSVVAAFLPATARNSEAIFAGFIALINLGIAIFLTPHVRDGGVLRLEASWIPLLGLDFVLRLDGFAWAFVCLISGIGLLVTIYARYYMSPQDPVPRFFSFLLGFMGAMLGVVISGNLIQIVFFWELTSLFSFLLIGYWHHSQSARTGARRALLTTGAGGLCLFAGMLVLGQIVGSYDLDVVLHSGDRIAESPLYPAALILILLGALTKSAQFPFHFWLPGAMSAPTPVSAYLHSATMVKAGVFLLARLWPAMAGHDLWFYILAPVGAITLLMGAALALFQQDLKGLLAYSTISHLGLITLLLALNSETAAVAAVFHILNHALFKASLFMAAGIIDHEAGTRDIRRLGGLARAMPITAALAMVAAAAMAGVPLMNGFLSKEMFFAETVATHVQGSFLDSLLPYVATLAGLFSVAYSLRLIDQVFFGPKATDLPKKPHDPVIWMLLPVGCLVLICLLVGLFPGLIIGDFLDTAVRGVLLGQSPYYSLAIWHGVNTALIMSVLAMIGGVVAYMALRTWLSGDFEGARMPGRLALRKRVERAQTALGRAWARSEVWLGLSHLQPQLRWIVCVAILTIAWPFLFRTWTIEPGGVEQPDTALLFVWLIGGACAIGAAYQAKYHRLAALIMTGGAGLAVCVTFAWLSAPDLALTQVLVEVVTTVLLLLGLRWLPKRKEDIREAADLRAKRRRAADAVIACLGGVGLAALSYAVMTAPTNPEGIARWLLTYAYSEGGGRNVVNVILVDFRGFDTLGEITVLGIVALSVYALLRRFRPALESVAAPTQKTFQDKYDSLRHERVANDRQIDAHYLLIPGLIMRLLFPLIAMMAMFLFLRGHDLPGGGFVAGLTFAVAFLLQYMAGGARWVEERLTILPTLWIGFGLLTALGVGAGAWIWDLPFLSTYFSYKELPVVGKIPVASALIFDYGVFTMVTGATVLILVALAHQAVRWQRMTGRGEKIALEEDR
ncbi:monovalent cation/H+ antiporter subunit A [Neomegalonema sp.]|uniref:monovalent cation/H+ antiporter subunit A n=1 Tax=Neomegalonema sp. TaxID=2039713 RepID=UPI0026370B61|nr:monovalent cation/H+ antiporter subunit A [Neomegalonema sp.]MDD2868526.1 monovalent cation/H+ antiporter subunit A [Neomegalonema sp.]